MSSVHAGTWENAVAALKAQPEQRALVEACFYDDPLHAAADRYHASGEWVAVRGLLGARRGHALDMGAGRGISSYALARDGWQVTALEPDGSDLVGAGAIRQLSADAGVPIEVVQTWGEKLPFADEVFDVVHCRQVLHHARDLKQLCLESARVLRPGGVLIATREHVISTPGDLQIFLDGHPLHCLYGGENAYLLDQYLGAISGAGLRIEQVLNPYQSDINTYPDSVQDVKRRWAAKLRLPVARLIPDALLGWFGDRSHKPGRLYTFLAIKPGATP